MTDEPIDPDADVGGVVAALLFAEDDRCAAISSGDIDRLAAVLDDALTHTHVTGRTETKAEYLDGLRQRPRTTSRGPTAVRLLGDVALMTGVLTNSTVTQGAVVTTDICALRVWLSLERGWTLVAFAASATGPHATLADAPPSSP